MIRIIGNLCNLDPLSIAAEHSAHDRNLVEVTTTQAKTPRTHPLPEELAPVNGIAYTGRCSDGIRQSMYPLRTPKTDTMKRQITSGTYLNQASRCYWQPIKHFGHIHKLNLAVSSVTKMEIERSRWRATIYIASKL